MENIIIIIKYFVDLITFYILGQKFVKFFVGFLENLWHPKDILKLTDLYFLPRIFLRPWPLLCKVLSITYAVQTFQSPFNAMVRSVHITEKYQIFLEATALSIHSIQYFLNALTNLSNKFRGKKYFNLCSFFNCFLQGFQLENWSASAWLDSARKLLNSTLPSSGNLCSNSSLPFSSRSLPFHKLFHIL